jgi:hypothetical protein
MGRFDALTQLDDTQAPEKKLDSAPLAPSKKRSSPLSETPIMQEEDTVQQQRAPSPVPERVPVGVRGGEPPPVPLIPKVKRVIRQRQPFDIYEDQYERLKQIAVAEKGFINGRGMSQMVRVAIDNYLKDHASPKE